MHQILRIAPSMILMFLTVETFGQEPLQQLYSSEGWTVIDEHETGRKISVKSIKGMELNAVMVTNTVQLGAETLLNVVADLANYKKIFTSSSQVTTTVLKSTPEFTDAYQHLPVPIPFLSDRHYIFRMDSIKDNRVVWTLISYHNGYKAFLQERDMEYNNPVYLESGIGIWDVIEDGKNSCQLSYRVYMDSGGNLPNFLIDWLNRKAIGNIFDDVVLAALTRTSENIN